MERYILKYLQDHTDNELVRKYIDYLKVDLDGYFYAYGENMNENYPMVRNISLCYYASFLKRLLTVEKARANLRGKANVLSFVPLPSTVVKQCDFNLLGSIVQPVGKEVVCSRNMIDFYFFYSRLIKGRPFNEILTVENCQRLEDYKWRMTEEYSKYDFKALFVGNGEPYLFKLHLDIFKELGIPSFIFLHGIPGIYDLETEKKADYLLVWGEQIRQNYVAAGFDPERVLVIGHPRYTDVPKIVELRNDLSNVLVTTTASVSWSPHGWEAAKFPIYDRSQIVLYCCSVQTVLQKLGVKHARLRVHPSVGKEWMMKFVDKDFFELDNAALQTSLQNSSLVIGPTSTVWLESILAGVNYIVYEPVFDGEKKYLVPPFDGSDLFLKIAFSEIDLNERLRDKYQVNTQICSKYIEKFSFKRVCEILNV